MSAQLQPINPLAQAIPSLAAICQLQAVLGALPQVDCPVNHHFSPGVYARETMIPEGATIVGKLHGTEHLLIVIGDVTILNGDQRQRITGTQVLNTLPGTKRAIHAHADTTMITIHVTPETDLAQIEADIILPDPLELIEGATP